MKSLPLSLPLIIGNWKMHKTLQEAKAFVDKLLPLLSHIEAFVGLAVPYTLIQPLSLLVGEAKLHIGAQNMNDASPGAFTGEIAASMLKDAGAVFVLLGHSERRRFFGEDNAFIARKVKKALETGLRPILCIGETQEEYEKGQSFEVLEHQIQEGLKEVDPKDLASIVIAYEPVWAIGSSQNAPLETIQRVHLRCREILAAIFSAESAEQIPLLYGGSVNRENAHTLIQLPYVEGLLIGGASLSLDSFVQIINDVASQTQ